MGFSQTKEDFKHELQEFALTLKEAISHNDEWTIKGFVDLFKHIYTISSDTKIISKVLELHLFPYFVNFARGHGYTLELASCQNWYPDLTFVSMADPSIKYAVDLKTTYRIEDKPDTCNGFTLGSHGEYFRNRASTKNIQYPYHEYKGHFCVGIIYSRKTLDKWEELKRYEWTELGNMPSVISNFLFFVEEKWKIASDKGGSGNTANIGSIRKISDLISGNGTFARAGENFFDEYWMNYGIMYIPDGKGGSKKLSSFAEFLEFKNLDPSLNNNGKRYH